MLKITSGYLLETHYYIQFGCEKAPQHIYTFPCDKYGRLAKHAENNYWYIDFLRCIFKEYPVELKGIQEGVSEVWSDCIGECDCGELVDLNGNCECDCGVKYDVGNSGWFSHPGTKAKV